MFNHRCAIGLGGNLGDAVETLIDATKALASHPDCQFVAASKLYRSAAIGPDGQPDYANAVLLLNTALDAWALLDVLQQQEQLSGRVRDIRWGARTLDLDILLFNQETIQDSRLTVPHAELWHRAFVLLPLLDVQLETAWPLQMNIATRLEDPKLSTQIISRWLDPRWDTACNELRLHSRSC
jgi:2-amino-4-hydroxy-6-hydroxymethyldihydropteridine diphosphokinase